MKKNKILALALCLILIITSLCGCVNNNATNEQIQADFDKYIREAFIEDVSDNTLTLHYTLKNPEAYGLSDLQPKIYSIDMSHIQEDTDSMKSTLTDLKKFDVNKLTDEQQLIYKILVEYVENNLTAVGLEYYGTYLDSISGIQSNMPINFSEYSFYREKDVKDYLALLGQLPQFFTQALDYEASRVELGLGLSNSSLNEAISQCEQFISVTTDDNILIDTFKIRVNELNDLTQEQKVEYIKQNRQAFDNFVVKAYQNMIDRLKTFLDKGKNNGGLCNLELGKKYYEYLVRAYTGSSKTIDKMVATLEYDYTTLMNKLRTVYSKNPDAYNYYYEQGLPYNISDPTQILNYLQEQIKDNYPTLPDSSFSIKYVHKSLESVMSPAFYMIPPIDDYLDNVIYINNGTTDKSSLFSTLAHEGYPGHLFQTVYFNSTNPNPIRSILSFDGYVEGWATYVELDSYNMYKFDVYGEDLATVAQLITRLNLNLSCHVDIGVNYLGWNINKVASFLGMSVSDCEGIFNAVVNSPATYLKYYMGFLEINSLRDFVFSQLGAKFTAKGFNTALLNIGPCQFDILKEYLQKYVDEVLAK